MSIVVESPDGSKWEIGASLSDAVYLRVRITSPNGQVMETYIRRDMVDDVAAAFRMGKRLPWGNSGDER